jgi:hypothetical protein
VLSGAQVVHDRALKRLSLRQAVERSWTRSAKDKPDDLVVSSSQELHSAMRHCSLGKCRS